MMMKRMSGGGGEGEEYVDVDRDGMSAPVRVVRERGRGVKQDG